MIEPVLLITVVADELEEQAAAILRDEGAQGITIVPGRGLGFPEHVTFFGVTYRGMEKVLLCLVDGETAEHMAGRLNRELNLLQPVQGLAFCLPVDRTGGIDVAEIHRELAGQGHADRGRSGD